MMQRAQKSKLFLGTCFKYGENSELVFKLASIEKLAIVFLDQAMIRLLKIFFPPQTQ